jgi:hypothetical protein
MLIVTRYINGKKVEDNKIKNIIIESDLILKTIQAVNERVKNNFHQTVNNLKK